MNELQQRNSVLTEQQLVRQQKEETPLNIPETGLAMTTETGKKARLMRFRSLMPTVQTQNEDSSFEHVRQQEDETNASMGRKERKKLEAQQRKELEQREPQTREQNRQMAYGVQEISGVGRSFFLGGIHLSLGYVNEALSKESDPAFLKGPGKTLLSLATMLDGLATYSRKPVPLGDRAAFATHRNILSTMMGMAIGDAKKVLGLSEVPETYRAAMAETEPVLVTLRSVQERFVDEAELAFSQKKAVAWNDILSSSTEQRFVDISEESSATDSGQMNVVRKIGSGDQTMFFKPGEKFLTMSDVCRDAISELVADKDKQMLYLKYLDQVAAAFQILRKMHTVPETLQAGREYSGIGKIAETISMRDWLLKDIPAEDRNLMDVRVIQQIKNSDAMTKRDKTAEASYIIGLHEGDDFVARNIATTKIAQLFGLDSLYVRSEKATITESGSGTAKAGFFMAAARGMNASKAGKQYKSRQLPSSSFSGQYQNQLNSLLIMDNLLGQKDRHMDNAMHDVEETEVDGQKQVAFRGVTAIDNDLCLGKYVGRDSTKPELGREVDFLKHDSRSRFLRGGNQVGVLNDQGKFSLPYVDKALYERFALINEEMIRAAIPGLLRKECEDALVERFLIMKQEMLSAVNAGTLQVLESEQWGEETYRVTMERLPLDECGNPRSYLGSIRRSV